MKTPFKMNYSPVKGKIDDFFRSITKKATPETKAKRAEAKKTRKAGESQYQADVRTRGEASRVNKKVDKGELTRNIVNTKQKGDEAVRPKVSTVNNTLPQVNVNKKKDIRKKTSYKDAYKNADKKKYPTLALFTAAAKVYNDKK